MIEKREVLDRKGIEDFLRAHIFLHDATIAHVSWSQDDCEIAPHIIGIYRLNADRHFVPADSDLTIYMSGSDYASFEKLKSLEEYDFVDFEFLSCQSIKYCGRVRAPAVLNFDEIRAEKTMPARIIEYLFSG